MGSRASFSSAASTSTGLLSLGALACVFVGFACSACTTSSPSNDAGVVKGEGGTQPSDGGSASDGSSDSSIGRADDDSGPPISCPGIPCPSGHVCCAGLTTATPSCEPSCAPNDTAGCTRTADCAGSDGGPECCATAFFEENPDGSAFPSCLIDSLTSFCGSCESSIPPYCVTTETVQLCTQASDCAGNDTDTLCCAVYNTYQLCVSPTAAQSGQLTCL